MSQLLDRKSAIEAHFDRYAGSWRARLQEHAFAARYEAVRRIAAKLDPRRVLDVGCGTGDYCVFFDPVWTDYLGIDISPKMVDECRRAYPAYRFEVGDAERINAPDESADLVLDIAVLEYYDDPRPHISELARVTVPGGSIIVAVPNGSNRSRKLDLAADALAKSALGQAIKRLMRGGPTGELAAALGPKRNPQIIHQPLTVVHLRELGALHGLEITEVNYLAVRVIPEVGAWARRVNVSVSKRVGNRPAWKWLTRIAGTILIAIYRKRA